MQQECSILCRCSARQAARKRRLHGFAAADSAALVPPLMMAETRGSKGAGASPGNRGSFLLIGQPAAPTPSGGTPEWHCHPLARPRFYFHRIGPVPALPFA
jgi:hypothetical protein